MTTEASRTFMVAAERLPTLYSLSDEAIELLCALDDAAEGETDELESRLAVLATALAQKIEGYCSVIRTLEALRDSRKAEADRLAARAKAADNGARWLKERLLAHMQSTGQQRIETGRFTVRIQQNSVITCDVLEEMMVPPEFKKRVVVETVDKDKIKDHVRATGEVVPGTNVYRGSHVRLA